MNSCTAQRLPLLFAVLVLLLAWLLPNHYFPWVVAYQEFASFIAGLLLIATTLLIKQLKLSPAMCGFFILACIPLLQQFAGLIYFAGDAWMAALYLLGFALMVLAGYNLSLQPAGLLYFAQLLAAALVMGAVLSMWIALRQWLLLSGSIWVADLPPGGRPFANLAQPNSLATLLCMGLAGVLYFYEKRQIGRLAGGLLAVFLLFGVALTQSRTPWVAALAVTVFWGWKATLYKPRLALRGLLGWMGVYVLCIVALPQIAEWLHLSSSDPLARAQSLERWGMWVQFWQAIWQGPLWGYGWNQVSVAQVSVSLAYPVPILTEHSHNILLDLLLWNGPLLGGLIIVCIAAWLARLGWRARSTESLFALLAAGFVLVHGMLEFPLEYAFFLFPLGLLLGMVAAEQRPAREFELPRWLLGAVLVLGIGMFGWVWQEYRIIEEDHRLMRFEAARIGDLKAEQPAPDVLVLSQLREFIRFARTPATEHMNAEQLEWMRKVAHRYPHTFSLFRYALALGLNNQPAAARQQLLILQSLHGEKDYAEARQAWQTLQTKHPQLVWVISEE
jgi:hypothetical protein